MRIVGADAKEVLNWALLRKCGADDGTLRLVNSVDLSIRPEQVQLAARRPQRAATCCEWSRAECFWQLAHYFVRCHLTRRHRRKAGRGDVTGGQ